MIACKIACTTEEIDIVTVRLPIHEYDQQGMLVIDRHGCIRNKGKIDIDHTNALPSPSQLKGWCGFKLLVLCPIVIAQLNAHAIVLRRDRMAPCFNGLSGFMQMDPNVF